jgi:hypothetical protein
MLVFSLLAAQDLQPWQYVRHSARDNNGNVHVRFNGISDIVSPYQFYNWQNEAWTEVTLTSPEPLVYEALLPAVTGQTLRYRLRTSYEVMGQSIIAVNPAYLSTDTFPPALNAMGYVADDPAGDSVNVYAPQLDLTGSWFGYSNTKLYTALSNASNLFPTMNSFTSYNLYFAGLAASTSAVADSTVYAMLYTFNNPGVISPGLYKLGLTLADTTITYQYLAPIQSVASGGKLYLSCNISDLTNDPGFGTWPPQFNSLGYMAGSLKIDIDPGTLLPSFGIGDLSAISQLIFENHQYAVGVNTPPVILNPGISGVIGSVAVSFDYYDANQDFPLYAKIIMESTGSEVDFVPSSLDFSQSVHMVAMVPVGEEWSSVFIRISDNNIDYPFDFIDVANEDETIPAVHDFSVYPNPFNPDKGVLHIKYSGAPYPDPRLWIYNAKGQLIRLIDMESNVYWDGTDDRGKPVADGVYFMRHFDYRDMKGYAVNKIILIR